MVLVDGRRGVTVIDAPGSGESADEFNSLLAKFYDDRSPDGPLEELLVQQIASCYWRLRRIVRADALEFSRTLEKLEKQPMSVDYHGQNIVFHADSLPSAERLDTILRYEKAMHLQLSRALAHLDQLQIRRRGEHAHSAPSVQVTES